jgi:ribose transport system ATP-binding protein
MAAPLLKLEEISKSFGANKVLDSVSLEIESGRCYAIVGENGAGKSTLMKIIGGIYRPDSGQIALHGKEMRFASAGEAIGCGISIVHQELSLAGNLSVAQNIYCHREPVNMLGFIRWKKLYDSAGELFGRMGIEIDPRVKCAELSVGMQQIVEVVKAISLNAKIIIMDEPTSALSDREIDHLYDIVRDLLKAGVAVIFISHKLNEVFRIADSIYVLRDGCFVAGKRASETTQEEIINLMVGREMNDYFPPRSSGVGEVLLDVEGLTRSRAFSDVSFSLRKKEILGFAGLVGAGRTEVARGIFGADPIDGGKVRLDGKTLSIRNPRDAIREGICYLTEDRKSLGLFLSMTVRMNIIASSLRSFTNAFGFYLTSRIGRQSREYLDNMQIRPLNDEIKVINLSGGNQQKTLLAKWLCAKPKVLIADEPTRGVDIGAKAKIHQDLRNLAESGIGVIVISSELPEILGLCDRVVVFNGGKVAAILENKDLSQEAVMKYAMSRGSK